MTTHSPPSASRRREGWRRACTSTWPTATFGRGRVDEARTQLDTGLAAVDALGDDGYGAMIRGGLERLAERLAQAGDA